MSRPWRLILPGVALHIIQRGNNRSACFRGDSDHLTYLAHLRHLSGKYGCHLHAYCLMTNHVHLLMTPENIAGCARLMRDLGRSYVRYFNRRHGRTGTLWEGRFRSCVAESPLYVLACYRYIELNPVRAGMVQHPEGYLWSSYAVNGGMRTDPMIEFHEDFVALAADSPSRHAAYRALCDEKLDEGIRDSIRSATNGGYPLASDSFKAVVIAPLGARTQRGKPGPKVESPEAAYVLV